MLEDYNIQTANGYGFSMYNDCNALSAASCKGIDAVLEKDKNHTVENTWSNDLCMLILENELYGKSAEMFISKKAEVKVAIAKNDHALFDADNDKTKFLPARYQDYM